MTLILEPDGVIQSNQDAEQSVLGSILIDSETAMLDAREIVKPQDFYFERNRVIYQHMLELSAAGLPIDSITLVDSLRNSQQLELVGGITYLVGLSDVTPTSVYARFYAQIVADKAVLRRLEAAGRHIITAARDHHNPAEAIAAAGKALNDVNAAHSGVDHATPITDGFEALYAANEARGRGEQLEGVIYTGIPSADKIIAGFRPGTLIVIGGNAGMGKTVLGLQIATRAAEAGACTRFQSLEMTRFELLERAVSIRARVQYGRVKYGKLTPSELSKVRALPHLPLEVDDRSGLTVDDIALNALRAHRRQPLKLLVIDHLHLIRARANSRDKLLEYEHMTSRLKTLAKELGIVVILLAQLNRSNQKTESKRPALDSLRGSGSIEQDADMVIFPFRESYFSHDDQDTSAEFIIAKNRGGRTGSIHVSFSGAYQQFGEASDEWR